MPSSAQPYFNWGRVKRNMKFHSHLKHTQDFTSNALILDLDYIQNLGGGGWFLS